MYYCSHCGCVLSSPGVSQCSRCGAILTGVRQGSESQPSPVQKSFEDNAIEKQLAIDVAEEDRRRHIEAHYNNLVKLSLFLSRNSTGNPEFNHIMSSVLQLAKDMKEAADKGKGYPRDEEILDLTAMVYAHYKNREPRVWNNNLADKERSALKSLVETIEKDLSGYGKNNRQAQGESRTASYKIYIAEFLASIIIGILIGLYIQDARSGLVNIKSYEIYGNLTFGVICGMIIVYGFIPLTITIVTSVIALLNHSTRLREDRTFR